MASSGSLDAALAAAVLRLKLRYTLGYDPPNPSPSSGSFRQIEVRISDGYGRPGADYTVRSRAGYYASTANKTAARP